MAKNKLEDLLFKSELFWDKASNKEQLAAQDFSEDYKKFLNIAKTEKQVITESFGLAKKQGFKEADLDDKLGKNKKVYRVVFDEITERAVKYAFEHPRDIDMNLVKAQQARRILDRIVGYSISPILWKKVTRGLSAGRVQSVAVRLVVDREKEIRSFKPKEYWEIEAILKKKTPLETEEARLSFTAKLDKYENNKIDVSNKNQAHEVLNNLKKADFIVKDIRESKKKRHALPPFTTSTLQQEAFNKLHFPVSRTMRIAQSIYEGLEIGKEDMVGLITYMRTDSVRISVDAQKEARTDCAT